METHRFLLLPADFVPMGDERGICGFFWMRFEQKDRGEEEESALSHLIGLPDQRLRYIDDALEFAEAGAPGPLPGRAVKGLRKAHEFEHGTSADVDDSPKRSLCLT